MSRQINQRYKNQNKEEVDRITWGCSWAVVIIIVSFAIAAGAGMILGMLQLLGY